MVLNILYCKPMCLGVKVFIRCFWFFTGVREQALPARARPTTFKDECSAT